MYKILLIFLSQYYCSNYIFLFHYKPFKNIILLWLPGGAFFPKLIASGVLFEPCEQFLFSNGQELGLV